MDELKQATDGQLPPPRAIGAHRRTSLASNVTGRGAVVVIRPGALDYRKHPSKAGDQLIAYAPGAFLENDGK